MLLSTALGLLATSAPPRYSYTFSESVDAPTARLTAQAPTAKFLVKVRATGLGHAGSDTTREADATLRGRIVSPGGTGDFVTVRVGDGSSAAQNELRVLTDFRMPKDLSFEGGCEDFDDEVPCEAELFVEFALDGIPSSDVVTVEWSIDFAARAFKDQSPDRGPYDLPWVIEVLPR